MQSVHKILIHVLVLGAALCSTPFFLQAQGKAPLMNPGSAPAGAGKSLQVEVLEIQHSSALPDHIRHSGKFILLLVNRTPDPSAAFVLDAASPGEGGPASPHLLRWGGPGGWSGKHASSAIVDQAAGEYQLKSSTTGAVLCTISVE
jgi:hypothetical protein